MKKVLLPLAALALGSLPAMAVANVYASGLKVEDGKIHFILNDNADKVVLNIIEDGTVIKTADLGAGVKGANVVDMPAITVTASTAYNWSLTVSAAAVTAVTPLTDGTDTNLQVSSSRGIAVDNHQQSPAFGTIYTLTPSSHSYDGARIQTGVYAFNAALEPINQTAYTGGITWATSISTPNNIAVSDNGDIFICSWGDNANAGVYWTSPENLAATWQDVFASGTKNSAGLLTVDGVKVHGSVQDIALYGEGANRVLYTSDEDLNNSSAEDILVYNIGNLDTPWATAPSKDWGHPSWANANHRLYSDQRGGLWVSQLVPNNQNNTNIVVHLNSNGQVDFTDAGEVFTGNYPLGAMAVNAAGTLMCMADGVNQSSTTSTFTVASITWSEDGIPSLTKLYSASAAPYGNRPFDIAFDAADNVYILFNNAKAAGGVGAWALPKEKNEYTTMALDPITLDAMTVKAKANVYASALKYDNGMVSFILNDVAENVTLNLISNGEVVASAELGEGVKGLNEFEVPDFDISEGGYYNWSITTTATPVTAVTQLTDGTDTNLQVSSAKGIAVDNHQGSPAFGNVYAIAPSGTSITGARVAGGVYAFNAALEAVNQSPYTGGISWISSVSNPQSIAVADNGDVFIGSWADNAQNGVYWVAPEDLSGDWNNVFGTGTTNSAGILSIDGVNVHGSVQDIALYGEGENRVLYTSDEDMIGRANSNGTMMEDIMVYKIGDLETKWTTAPSEQWVNTEFVTGVHRIASDQRGGLWVSQYRWTESATYPCVFHFNSEGEIDYRSGSQNVFTGSGTYGAMAVNADGSLICVADANNGATFTVASISWAEDGTPSLTKLYQESLSPYSQPYAVAFDAADNVYIVFNSNGEAGGIGAWALPKEDNVYTTKALNMISVTTTGIEAQMTKTAISYEGGVIRAAVPAEVYSTAGVCVARGTEIDASRLASGLYIVRAGSNVIRIIR